MNKQKPQIRNVNLKLLRPSLMRVTLMGLLFLISSCTIAKPTAEISVEAFESYQPVPTNMPELSAIEGNAEIKFPSTAHEIHAYTTGVRDIFIMVRFSMDSSELSEFMDDTLCDQPLVKSAISQQPSENNFDWWVPDHAKYSEECYGEKGFSHQQIIIDMSDPEVFIVYVSTSSN
jgi:hypothetical protein